MSTDDKEAPPARPGAPENGRPDISNELKDKVSISSLKTTIPTKNQKDIEQIKMIENLNRKFFMSKPDFSSKFKENNEQMDEFLSS
jgi:hypothetical protein